MGGSAWAAFGISVGIGVGAGLISYTAETLSRKDKPWSWGDLALNGLLGGVQAAATFGIAFVGGRAGLFNKALSKMSQEAFLQYLVNTAGKISTSQALVYSTNILATNFVARFLLSTIPGAVARALITKIIKG